MGRVKLKIKRLETIDTICETFCKRKSIQETLLKEEKQKAGLKELEERLKHADFELNRAKDLQNKAQYLTTRTKDIEDNVSSYKKQVASLHKTSQDPELLRSHDTLLKMKEAFLKKVEDRKKVFDEVLKIGDALTLEDTIKERERLASEVDVERAKVKQLEQNRKKIEKGTYLALKEGLKKELGSILNVERAKVKQLEHNRKEIEDAEPAKAAQLEKNQKDIMHNFVEPGKDQFANDVEQTLALNPELPLSMEEEIPFDMVKDDKIVTIQIGEISVPLLPKPALLATQAEKPAAKP